MLAVLVIRYWRVAIALAVFLAIVLVVLIVAGVVVGLILNGSEQVRVIAGVWGIFIVIAFLSGLLDLWARERPESQMAARLVRLRDALTPTDWKSKKP